MISEFLKSLKNGIGDEGPDIIIYIAAGPSVLDKIRNNLGREANCYRCGYGDGGTDFDSCDIYPFSIYDDAKQAVKETSEAFPEIKPFIYCDNLCMQMEKVPPKK